MGSVFKEFPFKGTFLTTYSRTVVMQSEPTEDLKNNSLCNGELLQQLKQVKNFTVILPLKNGELRTMENYVRRNYVIFVYSRIEAYYVLLQDFFIAGHFVIKFRRLGRSFEKGIVRR